jgi:hypothetical protein
VRARRLKNAASIADVDFDTAESLDRTNKANMSVGEATIQQTKASLKDALAIVAPYLAQSTELDRLGHSAACALAKNGRAAEALVQVKRALAADYFDAERMETDRDLDLVRKTDAFRALYAAWRKKRR